MTDRAFLISSCIVLLAGGALRELAPTAFAHPEEWQTVLHSLRYELDDWMMSRRWEHPGAHPPPQGDDGTHLDLTSRTLKSTPDEPRHTSIAGIDLELFTYFKRTFYEVFQQEYRGSFQTRLEAFRQRMMFVVGGDDPVVRPRSVLDSGPPGGINLLEIAGLGHNLGGPARDQDEEQQRDFWLSQAVTLMHRFANRAAETQSSARRQTWFDATINRPDLSFVDWDKAVRGVDHEDGVAPDDLVRRLTASELVAIGSDGSLPATLFERCLDDLLARVSRPQGDDTGVLLILRNEVPSMLLPPAVIRERGGALFHDDRQLVAYCHGAGLRQDLLRASIGRIGLVLPWNAKSIMLHIDLHAGYPSRAESAGGQVGTPLPVKAVWEEAAATFRHLAGGDGRYSIRRFDGNEELKDSRNPISDDLLKAAKTLARNESLTQVAALPDCWVWLSRRFLGVRGGGKLTIDRAIRELERVVPDHCESPDGLDIELRNDEVRIVAVSRARYNPRHRGRLVVTSRDARKLLVHVALCLKLSQALAPNEITKAFE